MAKFCCSLTDVTSALARIRPTVHNTPLMTSSTLDKLTKHRIFLKTENFQKTGSFKIRGATNAVLKIKQSLPEVHCVVTDSSGNHGQALACAAQSAGMDCYVVMPTNSAKCKIESVKGYGANVVFCEPSEKARKDGAEELRVKMKGEYISASQHPDVIAGQGTMALEILEQNPDIDVIIGTIGGGGLMSGVATVMKGMKPSVKVIGAEPALANDCYISLKKGALTPNPTLPKTIADGARVSVGLNTWPIVREMIDDVITVTEDEIKAATLFLWERCKLVVEPTSGVAVAAILSEKFEKSMLKLFGNTDMKNVAVIVCGGNVDFLALSKLLA